MGIALIGEATAEVGGQKYDLVMDNAAWMAVEELLDDSYIDIVAKLVTREIAGKSTILKTSGALLYGATRRHCPELTFDECCSLVREHGAAINDPLGIALRGSLKLAEPEEGEAQPGAAPATKKKPRRGPGKAP